VNILIVDGLGELLVIQENVARL